MCVFSCPDHVLKGSSNNLEGIPGSIIMPLQPAEATSFLQKFCLKLGVERGDKEIVLYERTTVVPFYVMCEQ